jgi:hypothetical protein
MENEYRNEQEDDEEYEEEEQIEMPQPTNFIDKMTMELLMNKTQYQKYVCLTDPKKHLENQEFNRKLRKYKNQIMNLTNELIVDPTKQITNDVNQGFQDYARTLIEHFEIKELENPEKPVLDEDMLFDPSQMQNDEEETEVIDPLKSFWGKDRVVKKKPTSDIFPNSALASAFMNYKRK